MKATSNPPLPPHNKGNYRRLMFLKQKNCCCFFLSLFLMLHVLSDVIPFISSRFYLFRQTSVSPRARGRRSNRYDMVITDTTRPYYGQKKWGLIIISNRTLDTKRSCQRKGPSLFFLCLKKQTSWLRTGRTTIKAPSLSRLLQ